ncbi:hypothetical protein J1605_019769 [Eschrichtius robustus]|uniref:Uncharacterized protein n=1 Tax=Eschrichtius robustus TaxID=9764 RepID=A0AB34HNE8_ESCRO|nr:hypothetical protein J1605_019769 [Eschrichtius robustus]
MELLGPYIFLVYAAYNGEVQSALQRMTEKKAVEAFTVGRPGVCGVGVVGGPTYGRRIPALTPFPFRHLALRGTHGPRIPTAFSSTAEPERPAVELTAFKASGAASVGTREPQRRLCTQATAPLSPLNGCVAKAARSNGAASTSASEEPPTRPALRMP